MVGADGRFMAYGQRVKVWLKEPDFTFLACRV